MASEPKKPRLVGGGSSSSDPVELVDDEDGTLSTALPPSVSQYPDPKGPTYVVLDHEVPLDVGVAPQPYPALALFNERLRLEKIKARFSVKAYSLEDWRRLVGEPEPFDVAYGGGPRLEDGVPMRRGADRRRAIDKALRAIHTIYDQVLHGTERKSWLRRSVEAASASVPPPPARELVKVVARGDGPYGRALGTNIRAMVLVFTPWTAAREVILFEESLLASSSDAGLFDTVMHELAHYLISYTGSLREGEDAHGALWKALCIELGGSGQPTKPTLGCLESYAGNGINVYATCEGPPGARCPTSALPINVLADICLSGRRVRDYRCAPHTRRRVFVPVHHSEEEMLRISARALNERYDVFACPRVKEHVGKITTRAHPKGRAAPGAEGAPTVCEHHPDRALVKTKIPT